ncbi:MAG TPA: class I SAM-dependent methyltransferase [Acidimicrobiales bacterium]|nr:class I SAM-dependent methyltransferase [Acidimicrobiales bacterium]
MFRSSAHVYDLIYEATGKDYAAESSAVHDLIEERNPGAATLLDVACGTGGHLRHLRQWYSVTGVDLDPSMLDEGRGRLPGVPLLEGDMRALRLDTTFDAVICLFSSIGYMRDESELAAAVAGMAAHLNPGGVLVVDGWVRPDAWRDGDPSHVEVAADAETKVARVGHSRREGPTTYLEMHHLVATRDGVEHLVDHHELTLFPPESYEAAFRRAGLDVVVTDSPMEGRDRYVGTARPR